MDPEETRIIFFPLDFNKAISLQRDLTQCDFILPVDSFISKADPILTTMQDASLTLFDKFFT